MTFITNNNVYSDYPGILNDGRLFTNYNQSSVQNENIKKEYGITSNRKYKEFLIKHTNTIIERNRNEITLLNSTPAYLQDNHNRTPYKFNGNGDNHAPDVYKNSDLKSIYLSREGLEANRRRHIKKFI